MEERLWLYGDKAYIGKYGIMGAYKRKRRERLLGQEFDDYNRAMSSCRISVEQGFALVSNKWQSVDWGRQQKTGKSLHLIELNFILTIFRTISCGSNLYDCCCVY